MKLLVIVPAYNEAATLPRVVETLCAVPNKPDIVIINDASTDATQAVAEACGVPTIRLAVNLGIGGAVQTGFKYARQHGYDVAVQVDADGQHNPAQIPALIQPLANNQADMVIGSRFLQTSGHYYPPFARLIGMRFFAAITSRLVGQRITDTTSGFRAINRKLIDFFCEHYPTDFPDAEAIIMARKAGFRIVELPVTMNPRQGDGHSSIGFRKAFYYPFKMVISISAILIRSIQVRR